jgi:hypothetical protein
VSAGKVEGLDTVMANLNREVLAIAGGTLAGLLEAGLIIQRDAQLHVPVDVGNLKASAYTREATHSRADRPAVEVGFTAAYAVFVHENLEMKLKGQERTSGSGKGRYWDPQGRAGPKFLQNSVNRNRGKVLRAVQKHARVGR